MDRRDFLSPDQLVSGAAQFLAVAEEVRSAAFVPAEVPPPPPEYALLRYSRRAMATTFEVLIPFGTPGALPAAEMALDEIDRLEAQLSAIARPAK